VTGDRFDCPYGDRNNMHEAARDQNKKKWKKDLNAETENTPTNDGRRLEVAEVEAWLVQ
jgi:hypothetical protein